jgi:predicted FMN-binding regulatory protein PaiB
MTLDRPGEGRFAPPSWTEVADLIARAPLAWVVSGSNGAMAATPLPLRARVDKAGRLVRLDGHLARSNPQVESLRRDPNALILFMGLNGYISPSWMNDRTQAPTWTYESLQVQAELELFDDPARLRASLEDLVGAQEAGRPGRWALDEMGGRFDRLSRSIIGFEARVAGVDAKFKLGQDERPDVLNDILVGLAATGLGDLADAVSAANRDRAAM